VSTDKLCSKQKHNNNNLDSCVGIATGCRFHGWVSILCRGQILLFFIAPRPAVRPAQPPILWVPGVFFPWDKAQGREANRLPPSSAEVKNDGAIPPLPHMYSWQSA
jgi:hypothetical protein